MASKKTSATIPVTTTVMTDEPLTGKKVKPTIVSTAKIKPMSSGSNASAASKPVPTHPDHHIHVMYMIMTSFLISLIVGVSVWLILDTRMTSLERTVRIQQAFLNGL